MEHEIKHIQIRVDPQTYKQLRILGAEQGCTLQALFERLIHDCLKSASESRHEHSYRT